MAFDKVKNFFNGNDERYEVLYYKYSKIKLENQHLKEMSHLEIQKNKNEILKELAQDLINLYDTIETAKNDSFKVKAIDKDLQKLLIDVNTVEKKIKDVMKKHSLEEITAQERFYDPELHEVASYEPAKGMAKGIILKTVKKGFKYKNSIIKKPKVLVTK